MNDKSEYGLYNKPVMTERKDRKKLLIPFVSVIVSLLIIEIVLNKYKPQKTYNRAYSDAISCFSKSDTTVFTLKPDCIINFINFDTGEKFTTRTNKLGYRGNDFSPKKKKDEKRIIFDGDSFILGFGVKDLDLITQKVEEKLKDDKSKNSLSRARIINAGYTGGFGPDGYFLHLKNQEMFLSPDLVVFSIFVFNDFSDIQDDIWVGTGKYGEPKKVISKTTFVDNYGHLMPLDIPLVYKIPILRNSNLGILTADGLKTAGMKAKYLYERVKFKIFPPVMPTGDATDDNLPGAYESACIFGDSCHRKTLHLFSDLSSVITASNNLVQSQFDDNKMHFVVLIIPVEFQLYSDTLKKYQSDDGIPKNITVIEDPNPQKRIKGLLDSQKIPYIDLLPIMRKSKERLYFNNDGHWNSLGHSVAAEAVYNWIEENYKN